YLSVLGIIYFYPKFNAVLNSNNSVLKTLWSYISISLAAQLATFPLVTYYFYFFRSISCRQIFLYYYQQPSYFTLVFSYYCCRAVGCSMGYRGSSKRAYRSQRAA